MMESNIESAFAFPVQESVDYVMTPITNFAPLHLHTSE